MEWKYPAALNSQNSGSYVVVCCWMLLRKDDDVDGGDGVDEACGTK